MKITFSSTLIVAMRAFLYVVLGIGALVGYVPALIADLTPGPLFFVGLPIMLLGVVVYLWTAWSFVSVGRGTPLPLDPPRVLVVHGLYKVVRNPMALGFLIILVGEVIAFGALEILAYAAALLGVIHVFIVFIEEPALKLRFGQSYQMYCQSVSRWIPRFSNLRWLFRNVRRSGPQD